MSARGRLGNRWGAAVAVALVLTTSACSSSGSGGSSAGPTTSVRPSKTVLDSAASGAVATTPGPIPTSMPKPFTGSVDSFYVVPKPLPAGKPGQIIRIQSIASAPGTTTWRVMYHSIDSVGKDRAVTGTIAYPSGAASKGGWPVISWAHGTTGLAAPCAPSRSGVTGPGFGIEGVRVATDYIGLGPVGELHSYLDGTSEAHAVIDAVRAARQLPAAHASTTWVAAGHSQGGHSALWTNQLGRAYAPELDLRGTAAIAPASMLEETYGPTDQVIPRMVGLMALYGAAADHPNVHPHDFVGPEVAARDSVIRTGCLDDIVNKIVGVPAQDFYKVQPLTHEPTKSLVAASDPGKVKVAEPLLIVYGSIDAWVVPARVHALFDRECHVGQVTDVVRVVGATHDTVVAKGSSEIGAWLDARLRGSKVHDGCADGFS